MTTPDDDRAGRFADYARAHLWVDGIEGRTVEVVPREDGPSGAFPFGEDPVHVVTAFDPGPQRYSPEENARRQAALESELPAGTARWSAVAGAADGSHTETSVLVVGLTDDAAVRLGARWGQDAVFRWSPATWAILPCDGSAPIVTSWAARRVDDRRHSGPTRSSR